MATQFSMIGSDGRRYQTRPVVEILPEAGRLWMMMAAAEQQLLDGENEKEYGQGIINCLICLFGEEQTRQLLTAAEPAELLLLTAPLFRYYLLPELTKTKGTPYRDALCFVEVECTKQK